MKSKPTHIPLERSDMYGPMRLMTVADGYVMARRKKRTPFVVSIEEWCQIGEQNSAESPAVVPSTPVL